jgi:hypothetical protein
MKFTVQLWGYTLPVFGDLGGQEWAWVWFDPVLGAFAQYDDKTIRMRMKVFGNISKALLGTELVYERAWNEKQMPDHFDFVGSVYFDDGNLPNPDI